MPLDYGFRRFASPQNDGMVVFGYFAAVALLAKGHALRFIASLLIVMCGLVPLGPAQAAGLERGAAITDPFALRELDRGGFAVEHMLQPAASGETPIRNDALFALPSMAPVRDALDREFDRYIAKHKATSPGETIGVGPSFDLQLFDRALLTSAETRLVLAGIVNRMDRAYLAPESCGEIRLIYRLVRLSPVEAAGVSPRLPMVLNIVLKAKADDDAITCAEIARRWLAAGASLASGAELVTAL